MDNTGLLLARSWHTVHNAQSMNEGLEVGKCLVTEDL